MAAKAEHLRARASSLLAENNAVPILCTQMLACLRFRHGHARG